jgi:hypothetical protein
LKLILGLLKGAIIGGAVGYGAYAAGLSGGFNWLTYGVIGAFVGLLVGKPLWVHLRDENSTAVTPIIRAVFGYGVCVGLYALVAKAWGGFDLTLADETRNISNWTFILGGAIGAIFGAFVEVDDSVGADEPKQLKS